MPGYHAHAAGAWAPAHQEISRCNNASWVQSLDALAQACGWASSQVALSPDEVAERYALFDPARVAGARCPDAGFVGIEG